MLPSLPPRVQALVTGYSETGSGSAEKMHTVYHVVARCGNQSWEITKRYSDFLYVHDALRLRYPEVAAFKFPNKSKVYTFAKFTKERRQQGFDEYLRLLCNLEPQPSELFAFIGARGAPRDEALPSDRARAVGGLNPRRASAAAAALEAAASDALAEATDVLRDAGDKLRSVVAGGQPGGGDDHAAMAQASRGQSNTHRHSRGTSSQDALSSMVLVSGSVAALAAMAFRLVCFQGEALHAPSQSLVALFWAALLAAMGAHRFPRSAFLN